MVSNPVYTCNSLLTPSTIFGFKPQTGSLCWDQRCNVKLYYFRLFLSPWMPWRTIVWGWRKIPLKSAFSHLDGIACDSDLVFKFITLICCVCICAHGPYWEKHGREEGGRTCYSFSSMFSSVPECQRQHQMCVSWGGVWRREKWHQSGSKLREKPARKVQAAHGTREPSDGRKGWLRRNEGHRQGMWQAARQGPGEAAFAEIDSALKS